VPSGPNWTPPPTIPIRNKIIKRPKDVVSKVIQSETADPAISAQLLKACMEKFANIASIIARG
jgi:hypothetical protein